MPLPFHRFLAATAAALLMSGLVSQSPASAADGTPETCAKYGFDAGFRAGALIKAIAIGMAESSCYTHATGPTPLDQGMWQIRAYEERVAKYGDLTNPVNNAKAAYELSDRGRNWGDWATNCSDASSKRCYAHWMDVATRTVRSFLVPDVNGDGFADVVGVDGGGKLVGYHNGSLVNAGGLPFVDRTWRLTTSDWTGFRHLALGDVNHDGFTDLVAARGDGALVVYWNGSQVNEGGYPYLGAGWTEPDGTWNTMRQFAVGDVTGDGYADIVAVEGTGALVVYANGSLTNAGGKPFTTATWRLGDWSGVRDIAVTDVNLDGYADIVGIDSDGKLFGYHNGSQVNPGRVPFSDETWRLTDSDWNAVADITAGDTSGDRYGDLVAVGNDGSLSVYDNGILLPGSDGIPYHHVTHKTSGTWNTFLHVA